MREYGSKKRKDIRHALRCVFERQPVYSDELRTDDDSIASETQTKGTL
jgi:hypothetical protein